MKLNGWTLDFDFNPKHLTYVGTHGCEQAKYGWYGWSTASKVGTIFAILKGAGKVTVDFGNCWNKGTVKLYLDDNVIATAAAQTCSSPAPVACW